MKKYKLILLNIGSFLVSILPLFIIVIVNWKDYTRTPATSISLGIGGAIVLLIFLLKAINRMPKNINSALKYGIMFAVVWLLEPLLMDIKLLLGCAFLGELLDYIIFSRWIRLTKENSLIDKTASKTSEMVENVMVELKRSGRV